MIKCCKCSKQYGLEANLHHGSGGFVLACPHCGLQHQLDLTLIQDVELLGKVESLELTHINVPTLTTSACTDVTTTSATGNGSIDNAGGENCTRRGFCYMAGTSGDPTTANSVVYTDGSYGTGGYSISIPGLSPGTGYRVRAYAVNSAGTGYGLTVQLTTTSNDKSGTATLSGGGTTTGTGKKGGKGAALLSASGTLIAIGLAGMLGAATLSGGGSQSASGIKGAKVSATLSGGGTLTATGTAAGGGGGAPRGALFLFW